MTTKARLNWGKVLTQKQKAKPNAGKVDTHRAAAADKIELRRRVLAEVGGAVFDAYAGGGEMYRRVWHQAEGYCGCDLRWFKDERLAYVADNRRVLRAIDLGPYRIFDFDSWGSPWEAAELVAYRRKVKPGERIGFVLTEGSSLKMRLGQAPTALARLAGIDGRAAGLVQSRDEIIQRALHGLARQMNCRILRGWHARGKTNARISYLAITMEGLPVPASIILAPTATTRRHPAQKETTGAVTSVA